MGADLSNSAYAGVAVNEVAVPVNYSLMSDEHLIAEVLDEHAPLKPKNLFNPPFHGEWSVYLPNMKSPRARTGHFTITDEENQYSYIGYGTANNGETLGDLWRLDLTSLTWKEVKLHNANPKNGCRGVLYNRKIILFGGFINNSYSNDLQAIDIDTGSVVLIDQTGDIPEARSTPLVGLHDHKIYMWGGYNGNWPNSIHVLDLKNMNWQTYHQHEKGRTSVPSIVSKGRILSYGGSHASGLFTLDMNLSPPETKIYQTFGVSPPPDVMSAGMIRVNDFIFYFGGKAKDSDWTILYALDVPKKWWFVFHVRPDGETVSISDGSVSENGIFMLPRIHSFGAAYSSARRAIVAFLGWPAVEPPSLFMIKIGEALSCINMRSDMCQMLKL
ncbi:Kelch motif family protein [Tritrichomonas foetus]|uniref:Kelch motif family protein n=1 Tax=Tritrichomonas foetus TaxID=1144522 RepID=A0A1J4KYG3_9EUKA|nr:Kelch motif family protein [Tritrichomonas foetus]|eukprot:OHT16202.1 Kelch motif family protein [Tritrichomonas foetus]